LTERVKEERRRGRRSAQAWLDAFVVGTDGALHHKWWQGARGLLGHRVRVPGRHHRLL